MTVVVMFPREASSQIREAISLAVGLPLNRVYKDNDDLYFYPDEDSQEIHFKISQHISRVVRKQKGHENFLALMKYFNENVTVLSEDEYSRIYFGKAA